MHANAHNVYFTYKAATVEELLKQHAEAFNALYLSNAEGTTVMREHLALVLHEAIASKVLGEPMCNEASYEDYLTCYLLQKLTRENIEVDLMQYAYEGFPLLRKCYASIYAYVAQGEQAEVAYSVI